MTTEISPQMKIVALAGVLLIALAGSALMVLRHSKPRTVTVPLSLSHQSTSPAQTTSLHTSPAPAKLKVVRPAVNPLLPGKLRAALERHPLVVVATFDPQVKIDALTVTEARAGAAAKGAGFVGVDLLDNRVAGRLTALLPSGQLLPSPGILVYKRPGRIVFRYDGYLDRDAIAQAVADAK